MEGGVVYNPYSSREDMTTVILILVILAIVAYIYGWRYASEIDILIEIKSFGNPYYKIGVSYETVYEEEEYTVEEFVIGLFFINIIVAFHKFNA